MKYKEKFIACNLKKDVRDWLWENCQIEVDSWRLTKSNAGRYHLDVRVTGMIALGDLELIKQRFGFAPIVCPVSPVMLELYHACCSEEFLSDIMEEFNG